MNTADIVFSVFIGLLIVSVSVPIVVFLMWIYELGRTCGKKDVYREARRRWLGKYKLDESGDPEFVWKKK